MNGNYGNLFRASSALIVRLSQ